MDSGLTLAPLVITVSPADGDGDGLPLGLMLAEGLIEWLGLIDAVPTPADGLALPEGEMLADGLMLAEGDADADGLTKTVNVVGVTTVTVRCPFTAGALLPTPKM